MFNFFKKIKVYPPFTVLNSYSEADKYFVRCARWRRLNKDAISIIDPHGPRLLTLDPWPQILFLAADGSKTVREYVFYAAGLYSGTIPSGLDSTIIAQLDTLQQYGLIKFLDRPRKPDNIFDIASQ